MGANSASALDCDRIEPQGGNRLPRSTCRKEIALRNTEGVREYRSQVPFGSEDDLTVAVLRLQAAHRAGRVSSAFRL